jgi:hypothetical protein
MVSLPEVRAAKADPRLLPLGKEMDRSGKVDPSFYELKRIQVEEAEAIPITGGSEAKIVTGDFREQIGGTRTPMGPLLVPRETGIPAK